MPCPTRIAARRVLWIKLFKLAIDDLTLKRAMRFVAVGRPGCGRRKLYRSGAHMAAQIVEGRAPAGRDQQQKTDRIGKKARRQQQRACQKDHRAMGQRFGRIAHFVNRGTDIGKLSQTLFTDHPSADDRGDNDDRNGRPQADQAADLNEKCDLDDRDRKEQNEQGHEFLYLCAGRQVDLPCRLPYIRACRAAYQTAAPIEVLCMGSSIIQLLVLAGIAIFLILRLRNVLGTRDGFEKPPVNANERSTGSRRTLEVIEGGKDHDIIDHVPEGSSSAEALARMKRAEPGFSVGEFLSGARGAYEMILMAFEHGDMSPVSGFVSADVSDAFQHVIDARREKGLTVEASFAGLGELELVDARFDENTREGELTVKFVGELTSVVRNPDGEIVEGDPNKIKRQRDIWTFARHMGVDDPNWQLVATGA